MGRVERRDEDTLVVVPTSDEQDRLDPDPSPDETTDEWIYTDAAINARDWR